MPSGDAQRAWFPEMLAELETDKKIQNEYRDDCEEYEGAEEFPDNPLVHLDFLEPVAGPANRLEVILGLAQLTPQ